MSPPRACCCGGGPSCFYVLTACPCSREAVPIRYFTCSVIDAVTGAEPGKTPLGTVVGSLTLECYEITDVIAELPPGEQLSDTNVIEYNDCNSCCVAEQCYAQYAWCPGEGGGSGLIPDLYAPCSVLDIADPYIVYSPQVDGCVFVDNQSPTKPALDGNDILLESTVVLPNCNACLGCCNEDGFPSCGNFVASIVGMDAVGDCVEMRDPPLLEVPFAWNGVVGDFTCESAGVGICPAGGGVAPNRIRYANSPCAVCVSCYTDAMSVVTHMRCTPTDWQFTLQLHMFRNDEQQPCNGTVPTCAANVEINWTTPHNGDQALCKCPILGVYPNTSFPAGSIIDPGVLTVVSG